MTNREKVIKGLNLCLSGESSCNDCPYDVECAEAISVGPSPLRRDALELLKEQEAEQPIVHENSYGWKFYYCPKCKLEFYQNRKQAYCDKCGQKVKWDDCQRCRKENE